MLKDKDLEFANSIPPLNEISKLPILVLSLDSVDEQAEEARTLAIHS